MENQQPVDVELYIIDDFSEDKVSDRELVVIQTHLSGLIQELLMQTCIDEEK